MNFFLIISLLSVKAYGLPSSESEVITDGEFTYTGGDVLLDNKMAPIHPLHATYEADAGAFGALARVSHAHLDGVIALAPTAATRAMARGTFASLDQAPTSAWDDEH
ncbi:hypothetical protein E4U43_007155 [Claviceps pusilla]|uniref:Uncharacterized protein n=1 Tax=Claviceps pusilla TaxID=123648 RepID=A0A9P7NDZ8_9HYPO|nr:hypothetical protein E4U43_007155 [Claviceps pusilla]